MPTTPRPSPGLFKHREYVGPYSTTLCPECRDALGSNRQCVICVRTAAMLPELAPRVTLDVSGVIEALKTVYTAKTLLDRVATDSVLWSRLNAPKGSTPDARGSGPHGSRQNVRQGTTIAVRTPSRYKATS